MQVLVKYTQLENVFNVELVSRAVHSLGVQELPVLKTLSQQC